MNAKMRMDLIEGQGWSLRMTELDDWLILLGLFVDCVAFHRGARCCATCCCMTVAAGRSGRRRSRLSYAPLRLRCNRRKTSQIKYFSTALEL